jgi:hypothetical protein
MYFNTAKTTEAQAERAIQTSLLELDLECLRSSLGTTTLMQGLTIVSISTRPQECLATKFFSRPYDLTRHDDMIHNIRKQKARCALCTETWKRSAYSTHENGTPRSGLSGEAPPTTMSYENGGICRRERRDSSPALCQTHYFLSYFLIQNPSSINAAP